MLAVLRSAASNVKITITFPQPLLLSRGLFIQEFKHWMCPKNKTVLNDFKIIVKKLLRSNKDWLALGYLLQMNGLGIQRTRWLGQQRDVTDHKWSLCLTLPSLSFSLFPLLVKWICVGSGLCMFWKVSQSVKFKVLHWNLTDIFYVFHFLI